MIFATKTIASFCLMAAVTFLEWSKWRTAEKWREADQALAWLKEIEH